MDEDSENIVEFKRKRKPARIRRDTTRKDKPSMKQDLDAFLRKPMHSMTVEDQLLLHVLMFSTTVIMNLAVQFSIAMVLKNKKVTP